MRIVAAALAVILVTPMVRPAARAHAQAAEPFVEIPVETRPPRHPHRLAYAALGTGAGLVGLSFLLTRQANARYDDYLAATDPDEVGRLYDETVRLDRWSTTSLIGGEALIVAGLYLRFLRRSSPLQLGITPRRCVVSLRF